MADAAVGLLVENLTQLVQYNAELIGDAKNQVDLLLDDLNLFKGFIKEYTEKRIPNPTQQALAESIRKVVSQAEDAIDRFVVEQATYKDKKTLGKTTGAFAHLMEKRNIAQKIKSIREQVSQIYTEKQFAFQALQQEPGRVDLQKPPIVEEDDVVGFDEEAKTVIERLNRDEEDLDIITIIGMPGLGKTTLAKKIYNDPTIEYEFFTRGWVFVSQTYSRKDILLSILDIFTPKTNYSDKSDQDIAEKVREYLKEGKYLIVMDDVWTTDVWEDIKNAFPNNKKGSRILITSRNNQVANHTNPTQGPHKLKFLKDNESWELLQKKVFGKEKCLRNELQNLGEKIAIECKGLPLAIVVIAGILLNDRESSDWWKQVAQDVGSFVVTEQERLLALSYYHLPYRLKSCFLYLGVFPEDYEIPVWKLIRLWIAEGFVEQDVAHLSLEDIAQSWVKDLINRNLLMAAQRSSNGQIKTCRVHDILHDFCKKEAQKQKLFQEITKGQMKGPNKTTAEKYRRICIHSDLEKYISSKPSDEQVRSFLCFTLEELNLRRDLVSTIPKGFKLLRVLELKSIIFDMFPKDLLQLVLLRYVALCFSELKLVPQKIANLWNIQTLIILTKSRTLALKGDMSMMHQLRHLYTNASVALPSPSSGSSESGENIQSLAMISPESCVVLATTPNIRKLGIRGKVVELFDNFFNYIGELKYLTNLKLFNDMFPDSSSGTSTPRLPPPDKFPPNLQKLTLIDTGFDWEDMHILENLETLEMLKLKDNAFKGKVWDLSKKNGKVREPGVGGFKYLKYLLIDGTNLETWTASEDHFPSLVRLVLKHCEELNAVPSALANVNSFQDLEAHRCKSTAVASAKEIKKAKLQKEGQASGGFRLSFYPPEN